MGFLIIGIILVGLKLAAIGPTAQWEWWVLLIPFGLAAAWWWFADATGLTKKAQARKMEKRVEERRRKQLATLGLRDGGEGGKGQAFEGPVTRGPSTHVPDALKPRDPRA